MTDALPPPPEEPDEDEDDLPIALPAKVVKEPGDVRTLKFSDSRVGDAVERQLAGVPAGTTVAFVATAFKDHDGDLTTKVAIYVNKGAWSFGGFIEGDTKRPLDKVGAELRYVR